MIAHNLSFPPPSANNRSEETTKTIKGVKITIEIAEIQVSQSNMSANLSDLLGVFQHLGENIEQEVADAQKENE